MTEDNQEIVVISNKAVEPKRNFAALAKKVKGLAEDSPLRKIQGSAPYRLTLNGSTFQVKQGSKVLQELTTIEKRGTRKVKVPIKELDIVIHAVSPVIQQQLLKKYDPTNPTFEPLGCWSNGDEWGKPDPESWNMQSESCDTCAYGPNGTSEEANCSLTRSAVVSIYSESVVPEHRLLMNFNWSSNKVKGNLGEDPDENVFGLINYLNTLATLEVETHRVRTRLIVDDYSHEKNNSKLLFQPIDILEDDDAPNMVAHNKWSTEDDLQKLCRITQRRPASEEGLPATGLEDKPAAKPKPKPKFSPEQELEDEWDEALEEDEVEETPPVRKKKVAAKKKAAAKKKRAPAPEPEDEEEDEDEELSLDELESFGEEVVDEEDEEDLEAEDEDDYGGLEELLEDD
jgi:hypothetical protein